MGDSEVSGWWRRHGMAAFILVVAAVTTFIIRVVYSYQLIGQCNINFCFAGGSDSFYHARVMTWIIQNHTSLVKDPLLNYPIGLSNPREPLFDWMNALLGIVFAPFFGGNAVRAGTWFLEMQPPFWAAMGVIPIYFLGKEVSSKRMGLVAAIIYPLFVGSIDSTVATYANYLPFYAFFVFLALAVYIHAIKHSGTRRWVESYRSPRSVWNGVKDFIRVEGNSFNWAVFAGVAMGATMLAWQGYTYVIAAVVAFLAITLIVERIRRVDSFGPYVVTFIVGTIAFLMAMPYYYTQGEFGYWFTVPMMIFYGAMLALLPFILLRDTPWLFSLGVMASSIAAAAAGLYLYNRNDFNAVITGQGYFIKTLIYSTVAEAQAPSFDTLIVAYGPVTFFLAFIGLILFVFYLYKFKFRREHTFMVILGFIGMYLPVSAAKFFLIGTPLFALLPAEVLLFALDKMGYSEMRHTARTLSESGGHVFAMRRAIKFRHLLIVIIAIGVLLPNVWYAVDAGIPYNEKSQYNQQIYNSLPPSLRTTSGQSTSFYLGAAGIETDTPSQYDENGYDWLATQDTNLFPQNRPAFISWWDYGFQAVEEGNHPTVADNFQDGIVPSGHFLLAQNESQAIAVLATDLMYAEQLRSHNPYLPLDLNAEMKEDGLNLTVLHNYLVNTTADESIVINNPGLYGPVNAANIQGPGGPENALYFTVVQYIASTLNENLVVKLYQQLQSYTSWSIGYGMSDTRLFPTSGSNTGIFYAPVDLTDGVISAGGLPSYYFTVNVTGSDGNTYPLGNVPPGVQSVSSSITYNSPFYKSMIYKIFVGYNGTQIGASSGVPGISSSLQNYPVEPGWMMQHFIMAYRTAYYCPYTNYSSHPGCFGAINYGQGLNYQKEKIGTADLSTSSYYSGGETFLEYYPGATVTGYVALSNGDPLPGVDVTMLDQWGYPHMVVKTDTHGSFTLIAPPGNDSVVVSDGTAGGLQQVGTTITSVNVTVSKGAALTFNGPQIFLPITLKPASVNGRVYWNAANNSNFEPGKDPLITGATLTLTNNMTFFQNVTTDLTGTYQFTNVPPGSYTLSVSLAPKSSFTVAQVVLTSGQAKIQNEGIKVSKIHGQVRSAGGSSVSGALVVLSSAPGVQSSTYTGPTGLYNFSMLYPGNYSLSASTSGGLSSPTSFVSLFTQGQNQSLNFTVTTPTIVSIGVTYNGLPVPNIPLRFFPLAASTTDSIVAFSSQNGVAKVRLTSGFWSIYALGALNGTWLTLDQNLEIGNGTTSVSATYALVPAQVVEGKISSQITGKPQSGVNIEVQSASGAIMEASTNSTGAYELMVPQDTYTFLATYAASGTTPTSAAVGTAFVAGTTRYDLTLQSAMAVTAHVGYFAYTGGFVGLPDSTVTVSFNGNSVMTATGSNGTMNLTLPQVNTTFTVQVNHYGFTQVSQLSFPSPVSLATAKQFVLKAVPISVAVDVSCTGGCPSAPQVNFTALSPPANSTSVKAVFLNGTYVATAMLSPGQYDVNSSAVSTTGHLWSQVGVVGTYIPIGAKPLKIPSITIVQQAYYHGAISIPNGTNSTILSQTTVHLSSPGIGNLTLTAASYTNSSSQFHAPPGNYTLWAVATNGSKAYSFLGVVSLPASGGLIQSIKLSPATSFKIPITNPYGTTQDPLVRVNMTATSGTGNGAQLSFVSGASDSLSLVLPNGTYSFRVNTTALINVTGILHYVTLTTKPNPIFCSLNFTQTSCSINLNITNAYTTIAGSTYVLGNPLIANGNILAVPRGGTVSSELKAPIVNGKFSLSIQPGSYILYAYTDGNGAPAVNVSLVTIPYSASAIPIRLSMAMGWYAAVTVSPPAKVIPSQSVGLNVTLNGTNLEFFLQGVAYGSPYNLILPSGSWEITAYTLAFPYGRAVTLSANASLTLVNANTALSIPLVAGWTRTATMTISGSTAGSASEGGNISFSFVLNDTGNSQEFLSLSGAPSTWNFSFTPSNVTLTPILGQNTRSVAVRVHIPFGTLLTQNSATFEALVNGSASPVATSSVTINILPIHQFKLSSDETKDVVGNNTISIFFGLVATGNTAENVSVSVQDGATLQQMGWSYSISGNFVSLIPGNPPVAGTLTLTTTIAGALLPSNLTMMAIDNAAPGLTQALRIPIPAGQLSVPGPMVVTGPNIGSPLPDYLTYLPIILAVTPAVAILTYAFARHWWKTRRWVRK